MMTMLVLGLVLRVVEVQEERVQVVMVLVLVAMV